MEGRADLAERVSERLRLADELAKRHSVSGIVCRVSRHVPSVISAKELAVRLGVPYEAFLENPIGSGCYLAVVNALNLQLVLLKVVEVVRRDLEAYLGAEPPVASEDVSSVVPGGLLTPVEVTAEPLIAFDYDHEKGRYVEYPRGVDLPIEPQSPVFVPKPELLVKLLGLPVKGCVLGCMVTEGLKPVLGVPVRLPLAAFYQHVLITGTTGAGKTTLIKNMIASMAVEFCEGGRHEATVVVIDSTGEYAQVVCDRPPWNPERVLLEEEEKVRQTVYDKVAPLEELTVVLPVTRDTLAEFKCSAEGVGKALALKYFKRSLKPLGAELIEDEEPDVHVENGVVRSVSFSIVTQSNHPATITILPWALEFAEVGPDIVNLSPIFTFQARSMLRPLVSEYVTELEESARLDRFIEDLRDAGEVYSKLQNIIRGGRREPGRFLESALEDYRRGGKEVTEGIRVLAQKLYELSVHRSTLENILRGLFTLEKTGLFDVELGPVRVCEQPYDKIVERGGVVVVDVRFYLESRDAESLVVYRLLNKLFEYKHRAYVKRKRTKPLIVVIDEAHAYFPARGESEESTQAIASMLTRIARLGRRHGMGLVFATHSPRDLNPVVNQLTNTKIALRSEKQILESLGLPPGYRRILQMAPDRVGVVRSHFFRTHYVLFKTTPPLVGHMDISGGVEPPHGPDVDVDNGSSRERA